MGSIIMYISYGKNLLCLDWEEKAGELLTLLPTHNLGTMGYGSCSR